MARALLDRGLSGLGVNAQVLSAGTLESGRKVTPHGVTVMAPYGLDTSDHLSQTITTELIGPAHLVLGMARDHVRAVVEMAPDAWGRTFTLKELVQRADALGPRPEGESLAEYLGRVHEGRDTSALLGASPDDDVADPIGRSVDIYAATAAELDQLVRRLIELIWKEGQ